MTRPLVVKFGGSSFAEGATDFRRIGHYLAELHRERQRPLIVVASAGPGRTEETRDRLAAVNPAADPRYAATAFSLPDTESAVLLAAAVEYAGVPADTLNSHQNGIVTDNTPLWSRVQSVDADRLLAATERTPVVCVASGHAADADGRFTWMGKNSGDLSALILAAALGVDEVEIYSDVDGVYSADPRLVSDAGLIPQLNVNVARIMASRGAKVLDRRALDIAHSCGITIVCRRNRDDYNAGTVVTRESSNIPAAVIIDTRSIVLKAANATDADRTIAHLHDRGLPSLKIDTDGHEHTVAVTGGYTNAAALVEQDGLPVKVTDGRLVSLIHAHRATDFIAVGDTAAIDLGRQLHSRLSSLTPSLTH